MSASPPNLNVERSQRRVIFGLILAVCVLLVYRGYGARFAIQPTIHSTPGLLNLNRADRVELLQVPGIGPVLADAIVAHRSQNGPYRDLEELDSVPGIGEKTREKLRPWLTLGNSELLARGQQPELDQLVRKPLPSTTNSASPKKLGAGEQIAINQATLEELQRLPGIGEKMAQRILEARKAEPFQKLEDLRRVSGIGPKTLEKLRPHLIF
jgi:competence protein ComEA